MDMKTIDAYEHSYSSLRWVLDREIPVTMIQIQACSWEVITAKTFEGIACRSIVSIDIRRCESIGAVVLRSLVKGCPQLSSINLTGCE